MTEVAWQCAALYLAIGCAQHKLFFPLHYCIHYSLFPTKTENRGFGAVLSALLGTSFEAIRTQHMEHHRDFGKAVDPGASDYFVRFRSRPEFLAFLLGPLVGSILLTKLGDYFLRPGRAIAAKEDAARTKERALSHGARSYGLILCVQAAVCALLTRGFQWAELWRYPVFYILPLVTVFLFFVRLRMFLEHGSLDYKICDYFEERRPTSRTIYASRLERVLICGGSFNFHHEHHLYPGASGWRLPLLHRELASGLDSEDMRQTYVQAFLEIWKNLPWQKATISGVAGESCGISREVAQELRNENLGQLDQRS
jgi:fatty acid desaturase